MTRCDCQHTPRARLRCCACATSSPQSQKQPRKPRVLTTPRSTDRKAPKLLTPLHRSIFNDEHEALRKTVAAFAEREVLPHLASWEANKAVPRQFYQAAGRSGLLGIDVAEQFGGGGIDDYRFSAIVADELCRIGAYGIAMNIIGFNDLVAPYFHRLGTDAQNTEWLKPLCSGDKIGAIAMTEPGTGSDLGAIATTAQREGEDYLLNGAKTFITNGGAADVIIVVAKTDPSAGKRGISLVIVEDGMPGLEKSGPLDKVGLSTQETVELHFNDVRVPSSHVLGQPGHGFEYLKSNLVRERLSIAVCSMAAMATTFDTALEHANSRKAFGNSISSFQANKFYLAELATEIQIAQVFVDRCVLDASQHQLDDAHAAMAKWWTTELHLKVVHRAVQLHGGYGYMREYAVARDYCDSRATTIFGGTTEIMKEIVGRRIITT